MQTKKTIQLDADLAQRLQTEAGRLGMTVSAVVRNRLRHSYERFEDVTALTDSATSGDPWARVFKSEEIRVLFIQSLIGARARHMRLTGRIGDTDQDEVTTFEVLKDTIEDLFKRAGYPEL